MQLQINHIGWQRDQPLFEVINCTSMKHTQAVSLSSPTSFPTVENPKKVLLPQMKWYLEEYLDTPYGLFKQTAKSTSETIKLWGTAIFDRLFIGYAQDWYQEARQQGLINLCIKISSDSPKIMSWLWEALYCHDDGYLALRCCINRQFSVINDPIPLPANLPQDAIHILFRVQMMPLQ